jgi:ParB-like chromosome segregation protein Spo0J
MINVEAVPLDQLLPHPVSQEIYGSPKDDNDFIDLVEHIRIHGVIEPILTTLEGVILNGRRRWEAAREAGLCCVPVQRLAGLDDTAQRQLIITFNWQRKRVPSVMVREALTIIALGNQSGLSKQAGVR